MKKRISIEFCIIQIIKAMNDYGDKAYHRSIRTILRGSKGPVSDKYKELEWHGKIPQLSDYEYEWSITRLLDDEKIIKNFNRSRNTYYNIFSPKTSYERRFINRLLNISESKEFDEDKFDFESQRVVGRINNSKSVSGEIDIQMIDGDSKLIQYESSYEKKFLKYIGEYEYAKKVIDQPVCIEKNGNKYYPDFAIYTYQNRISIVEIKAHDQICKKRVLIRYMWGKEYANEKGISYELVTLYRDEWISFENIKNIAYNKELEEYILMNLGETRYENIREYCSNNKIEIFDFYSILINNDLCITYENKIEKL